MKINDKVKVNNKVLMEYGRIGIIEEIEYTELYPNGIADVNFGNEISYIELEDLVKYEKQMYKTK